MLIYVYRGLIFSDIRSSIPPRSSVVVPHPKVAPLCYHLFLLPQLLLLCLYSLIFTFVKWGTPAQLLSSLFNFFLQNELTHLLDQLLILLLLLRYLLLFEFLLPLLLFEISRGPFMLLQGLDEETTPQAPTATVFPCSVLNQESRKSKVLTLRCLYKSWS